MWSVHLRSSDIVTPMYFADGKLSRTLTGDRRQTKQFCFLDFLEADCLVVGESQSSSRRSAGRYPVKPPHPEGDSQTIDTLQCRNS